MQRENRLERGVRLFDHPLFDWGSRVHPLMPIAFWGPLSLAGIAYGVSQFGFTLTSLGLFLAGYLTWLLCEYSIHRWFYHFKPRSLWMQKLFYYVHEHQHRYIERDRLLAPPSISLSIGGIFVLLFYTLIGRRYGMAPMTLVGGGFGVAYLVYDYTHLYLHFAKPRSRWGRFLRRCHMEHHHAHPGAWYCISFPLLDYVFRTHGGVGRVERGEHEPPFPVEALPRKIREFEATRQ